MNKKTLLKDIAAAIINVQTMARLTANTSTRRAYRAYIFDMSILSAKVKTTDARTIYGRNALEDYAEEMAQHLDALKTAIRVDYYAKYNDWDDMKQRTDNAWRRGLITYDEWKRETCKISYVY